MQLQLYLYLFAHLIVSALTFSIPEPKVELISPEGLRISIPHENGIALVAFHVNIDKPIALNQPGEYSADITEPVNGRWIFEKTRALVDANSKINYWLHVQYGNYAYRKLGIATHLETAVNISDEDKPTVDSSTSKPIIPSGCEPSRTTVNRRPVCKGELIFEDNFDNLNLTKWQREVRLPMDVDDAEFVSFQARDENCYTDNSELHIVPSLLTHVTGFESNIRSGTLDLGAECTAINDREKECKRKAQFSQILPPVVSARIRTKDFFSFRYGKIEVRAKMPRGDWLYPLIVLEPLENYYGATGYKSGQIRVAFMRGNVVLVDRDGNDISGNHIEGGVILSRGEELRKFSLQQSSRGSHLGNDFHTYSLTWIEDMMTLDMDGKVYGSFRGNYSTLYETHNLQHASSWKHGDAMAPFDREFYLTLGVSVGGHSDFPDGSRNNINRREKPWKNNDPKAELQFWNNREHWLTTWNGANAGLHVDYVRVYAL